MIDPEQLTVHVLRPALFRLEGIDFPWAIVGFEHPPRKLPIIPYTFAAERLLLGTAYAETQGGRWLVQRGRGKALGITQVEPDTYTDIRRYLNRRKYMRALVDSMDIPGFADGKMELVGNLWFAFAICRVRYWMIEDPLPDAEDIRALGKYWRKWYNTPEGGGTIEHFERSFPRAIINPPEGRGDT